MMRPRITIHKGIRMLVAVDIGNTNIVLGFLDGDDIIGTYRITTKSNHTSDEYGLMITQFLALSGLRPSDIDDVIIASVVPKVMHSFRASIIKFLNINPMVVGPGIKTGINIRIDDPKSLGSDCLITCGLITTGIRTAAAALWGETAQLPEVEITKPKSILATGTKTAMQAGLYYNFLGGIERTIRQFRMELDEPFTVVATGGLGRVFKDDTELIDVYDPELIFKGMALIHSRNSHR